MHRHDGACARGDRGLECLRVDIVSFKLNISENSLGARILCTMCRCYPGKCRNDNLVARAQLECEGCQVQRGCARGCGQAMRDLVAGAEQTLELRSHRPLGYPM